MESKGGKVKYPQHEKPHFILWLEHFRRGTQRLPVLAALHPLYYREVRIRNPDESCAAATYPISMASSIIHPTEQRFWNAFSHRNFSIRSHASLPPPSPPIRLRNGRITTLTLCMRPRKIPSQHPNQLVLTSAIRSVQKSSKVIHAL